MSPTTTSVTYSSKVSIKELKANISYTRSLLYQKLNFQNASVCLGRIVPLNAVMVIMGMAAAIGVTAQNSFRFVIQNTDALKVVSLQSLFKNCVLIRQ